MALVTAAAPSRAAEKNPSAEDGSDDVDDDDDGSLSAGAEADFVSRSLWRGLALSDGPVLHPSTWVSFHGFTASVWGDVLLTDSAPHRLSAFVPSVSYAFVWRALKVEPGLVYYETPNEPTSRTAEGSIEASLAFGVFHVLSNHYIDVWASPGAYFGTLGPEIEPKIGRWTFDVTADVGWGTADFNQAYFGARTAAIDVVEGRASVRYDLTRNVYVTVHAEGSALLSSSLVLPGAQRILGSAGTTLGFEL